MSDARTRRLGLLTRVARAGEREAQTALAGAHDEQRRAEQDRAAAADHAATLASVSARAASGAAFAALRGAALAAAADVSARDRAVADHATAVENARQRVVSAAADRRAAQLLTDRHVQRVRAAADAAEQRHVDDLAGVTAHQRRTRDGEPR